MKKFILSLTVVVLSLSTTVFGGSLYINGNKTNIQTQKIDNTDMISLRDTLTETVGRTWSFLKWDDENKTAYADEIGLKIKAGSRDMIIYGERYMALKPAQINNGTLMISFDVFNKISYGAGKEESNGDISVEKTRININNLESLFYISSVFKADEESIKSAVKEYFDEDLNEYAYSEKDGYNVYTKDGESFEIKTDGKRITEIKYNCKIKEYTDKDGYNVKEYTNGIFRYFLKVKPEINYGDKVDIQAYGEYILPESKVITTEWKEPVGRVLIYDDKGALYYGYADYDNSGEDWLFEKGFTGYAKIEKTLNREIYNMYTADEDSENNEQSKPYINNKKAKDFADSGILPKGTYKVYFNTGTGADWTEDYIENSYGLSRSREKELEAYITVK